MPQVIGIDHIYITVLDLQRSEIFYDLLFIQVLEFKKNTFQINQQPHIQYYNHLFGFVIRPAYSQSAHDAYAPGLHHFCLRVESADDVISASQQLKQLGIACTAASLYADYAADYIATFLTDPDGIRLEITNYRQERKQRHDEWNHHH